MWSGKNSWLAQKLRDVQLIQMRTHAPPLVAHTSLFLAYAHLVCTAAHCAHGYLHVFACACACVCVQACVRACIYVCVCVFLNVLSEHVYGPS